MNGGLVLAQRLALAASLLAAACSESNPASTDGPTSGDLASSPDLGQVLTSQCVDQPATDGQACGNGCGNGTTCAGYAGAELKCYQTCDVAAPACPCGRRCVAINGTTEAACLPANGAGERCGTSAGGVPYGNGGACADGMICAGPPETRYCVPTCETSSTCAAGTSCKDTVNNRMVGAAVCWFNQLPEGGLPVGSDCNLQTFCVQGSLCKDGKCRAQCGGPADPTCAQGTCVPMMDGSKTFAYVCQ